MSTGLVMYEEEFRLIAGICDRLTRDANAKVVFLVDKNGQLIASSGQAQNLDTTSLASLTAGNVAAMGGLAKLIGEKEFSLLFHEGEKDNMHISVISNRLILVVIFDKRSSVGLVRLRVRKATDELAGILVQADAAGSEVDLQADSLEELTEADIESLFK